MKYRVFGILSASVVLGEYEANSKEEAIEMAHNDREANWNPSLCWHCANEVEIGDVYSEEAEQIED